MAGRKEGSAGILSGSCQLQQRLNLLRVARISLASSGACALHRCPCIGRYGRFHSSKMRGPLRNPPEMISLGLPSLFSLAKGKETCRPPRERPLRGEKEGSGQRSR